MAVANVQRDREFFNRVEASEFLYTSPDGSTTTKAEDLSSLDKPAPATLLASHPDSMLVRIYGRTAVVWGLTTFTLRRPDSSVVTRQDRFTDMFVWRDARWQIVAGHASRLPFKQP